MKQTITTLLLQILIVFGASAQIRFYRELPELAKSPHFKVEIRQKSTEQFKEIFTYQITPNSTGHVTKNDQFANFGFNPAGGAIQIRVSRKDGVALNATNASLKNKTYTDVTTSFASGAMIIQCPKDKKHLYVSVAGKTEFPLMIFADPFADTPIPSTAKVKVFEAKSTAHVQGAQYNRYTVPNDVDAVVIEDGALVKGTIHTDNGRTKPLIVTGRGMLIGNGEVLHGSANIPYNALVITDGINHLVENIMVVNSRHFSVDVGDKCTLDNVKMYGYDTNNDGVIGGDASIIKNVFSKVNDDHVKLYNDNMKVQNCTFWVQQNGALFQLAWNSVKPGDNCLVENCEVLAWEASCGDPKLGQGGVARTFINLRETDSKPSSSNLTVKNVYVQGQLDRMLGINGKYEDANSLSFSGIVLENVVFEKKPERYSWIYTGNAPYSIDFTFKNVKIGGECLTASNYQINTEGNVKLVYQGCSTTPVNNPPSVSVSSNNTTFEAPASIALTATATDNDGLINNVKFYNGNTLLSTDNATPYTFNWTNVAAGTYTVTAVATDNLGAVKTSTPITLTVNEPVIICNTPANTTTVSSDASCEKTDGKITFNFEDASTRSSIKFSITGTNGYIAPVSDASGSYTFSGLAAGVYDCYVAWGNDDCPTSLGKITLKQATCTPSPITDLTASLNQSCDVVLKWSDVAGETGYRVRRRTSQQTAFTNIADVAANATSFKDVNVNTNVTYVYQVRPLVNGIAVELSNETQIKITCVAREGEADFQNQEVSVYPTEFNDYIMIENLAQGEAIQIYSTDGILLIETVNTDGYLNLSSLNSGIYILKTANSTFKISKSL